MTEKFCRDCVHVRRVRTRMEYVLYPIRTWRDGERWTCAREEERMTRGEPDPVTGRQQRYSYTRPSCETERSYGCGQEAKFWKPKNTKKHLFTILKD